MADKANNKTDDKVASDALMKLIEILEPLDAESRDRVIRAAKMFLDKDTKYRR